MQDMQKDVEDRLREKLSAIYSETTIDHIIRPRNMESLPNPDGFAACQSRCGESMKIWLKARNNIIQETGFWTNGCAATIACGSMCTELVKGKSSSKALGITARDIADALINLPEGNFHCAELAADTLRAALKDLFELQNQPWKKVYRRPG